MSVIRKLANIREKGQSLVEFAVGVTLLLYLVVGIVDASRALFTYLALRDAAQEGALYGSTDPINNTAMVNRACGSSNMMVDMCASGDVVVTPTLLGSACMGEGLEVTVTYANFPMTMPFIGTIVGSQTVPISASVIDTILRPPC